MLAKLNSKKLLATILCSILTAILPQYGVPPEAVAAIVKVVMLYLGIEGGLDALREFGAAKRREAE